MTLDALLAEQETPGLVWPDVFPAHLSASQLAMAQRCPEQWRRRYLLGLKERPAAALVWGRADHEAHAVNFTQKIDSHRDLPVSDVRDAFAEAFDHAAAETDVDWGDDRPGDLKDQGAELVSVYHRTVSPGVQPTAVEHKFELHIPGVPVPVIGYVDVIEDWRAIERKTAKRKETVVKPRWRLQGLLYQLSERKPIEWHVSVKTKTPAVYTPDTEPGLRLESAGLETTRRMVATRAAQLVSLYERFGPDEPWPDALSDDWACSYCAWRPVCAWWQQ